MKFSFDGHEGWKEHPIDYSNWGESVILLGDSCTYGYGLQEEDRLHNQILTDRIVNNFGYPGWLNEHCYKIFLKTVKEHGLPHKWIIGWTSPFRYILVENGLGISVGPWIAKNMWNRSPAKKASRDFFVECQDTLLARTHDMIDAINLIDKNTFQFTFFDNLPKSDFPRVNNLFAPSEIHEYVFLDTSEDKTHPGPKTIKKIAEDIGEL